MFGERADIDVPYPNMLQEFLITKKFSKKRAIICWYYSKKKSLNFFIFQSRHGFLDPNFPRKIIGVDWPIILHFLNVNLYDLV